MTDNQRAALRWAEGNEKRIAALALQAREAWRGAAEIARISETITALSQEAARMREYAFKPN